MPNTYVALATQTLGTAASSVTFSSISSSYTDLMLVTSAKNNTGAQYRLQLSFNGDRGTSIYSVTKLTGNGSTATSSRVTNATYGAILIGTIGSTNFDNVITHIMNYSNTTTNKTVLSRGNETAAEVNAEVGLWRSTAAITSLTLDLEGGINFVAGSTFSLYGIANADQGSAKATGGIITEDSQYWYHTFGASGAFIPKQSLTCDYLVVAGGGSGGGGSGGAGGGGAGGYRSGTGLSLTTTTYNVTVGAGGPAVAQNVNGNVGSDSVFSTITSTGGGRGALEGNAGGNGGSGGGSAYTGSGAGLGNTPSTSPSQGNNGGNATTGASTYPGSGGGGAGAVGSGGSGSTGGAGGAGSNANSSWLSIVGVGVSGFLAGGGGGGTRSNDGGGAGGSGTGGNGAGGTAAARAGVVNTGGGGGGGVDIPAQNSGAGGSGVVIIRYAK